MYMGFEVPCRMAANSARASSGLNHYRAGFDADADHEARRLATSASLGNII
jgi:hypothetical protein